MGKIYVISDLDLFSEDRLKEGIFKNFDQMNEFIISQVNIAVKPGDILMILGNISCGDVEQTKQVLDKINGEKWNITLTENSSKIKEMGVSCVWSTSISKMDEDTGVEICYEINPITDIKNYEKFKVVVVDKSNPIEGLFEGKLLSADALKWQYIPIDISMIDKLYDLKMKWEE